ncbi:uncharacterized protein LOC132742089 isoform X2 [Ruditapes philippinarum]|uniref:uncharacterized protein LOC132742089 isoform X2 n=1 Tax=Ruditapes philippinarum TaxID=129788 RepID=UPI00295BE6CC|nr:uncharacterized protein LOC132742089 isoform X2 [Ruditapes philippinarum]
MAAEVNARSNKNSTIAFTLPISCQVCLGKVKNPVLCPNHHVFCGPCMDVWLQKNKQCPACRTAMTAGKKILGGLSQQEEDTEKLTNPDLRKARFDLLYKEYENEFERMHSEIQLLKTENQILKQQTRKDGLTPSRSDSSSSKSTDTSHLLALTKKLQDATKMYEKVKGELTRLKQENTNLKDENLSLNRENQHVRQELAGRSPHRYGRITVSTLETNLASAEKDVTRLTKALERSDKYIEELESELDDYRGKSGSSRRSDRDDKPLTNGDLANRKYSSDSKVPPPREYGKGADNQHRRQLFSDDMGAKTSSGERSKYYYDGNGDYDDDYKSDGRSQGAKINGENGGKKRVTFDLNKNTNSTMSFDLEMPSPLKTSANASGLANGRVSPVKGVLKKTNGASKKGSSSDKYSDRSGYSTDLSKDSLSDSYNQKSADRLSQDDDLLFLKSRSRSSGDRDYEDDLYSGSKKKYSADDSVLSAPSDLDSKRSRDRDYSSRSRSSDYDSRKRSDPLDDLDGELRRSRGTRDGLGLDKSDLDDTHYIESELDELNISLTPEFTDCMKILNRAEKNVHTRDIDPVTDDVPKYRSTDTDMDTAFRSSTGSIGQRNGVGDDFMSNYKTDTSKFTSSLDSYSRGRHVRSGSLDNLFIAGNADQYERPSSALPTTSNMYSSSNQNKYIGGLTTGRTTLTRTPSLDNLMMSRGSTGFQNKYSSVDDPLGLKSRSSFPGYLGRRSYGEEENKVDVPGSAPVTAKHDILGSQSSGSSVGDRYSSIGSEGRSSLDTGLDSHARGYSSDKMVSMEMEIGRKLPPSGRQTPTLPVSSTGSDPDKHYSSGRITPTIPTHSEYMALSKPSTDKYTYTANTGSGRSTPTLTNNTDYSSLTKSSGPYSGPSSLPTDMSQKPPTGSRVPDFAPARSATQGSYSSQLPPYQSSTTSYTNPGDGYHSLPNYTNSTNTNTGVGNGYGDRFENRTSVPSYMGSSSSSLGLSSYPGPSSASSYLPTTLNSLTSSSSYSTAHSVPLTFTTSSYTSSVPANTYSSKGLDPISESGHYSYVSNVSGDYSSKNDTFALPEPKKRLFENSDDLDMSMSPIKSNRRF